MYGAPDPVYVRARSTLLDALEALQEHRSAVLLVGAQAIYLHTGEADLAVAPYTSDADLALDPRILAHEPLIDSLLRDAGFVPAPETDRVGTWIGQDDVPIDLLVADALSGPGRRGARLGPQGNRLARRGRGLEAALVENGPMTIQSLEPGDQRSFEVVVAGPTALLVAKLHKIAERQEGRRPLDDKDALDVYRLLVATQTDVLAGGSKRLLKDPLSAEVTQEALTDIQTLFGAPDSLGSQMAARSVGLLEDPATIAASCAALAGDLLAALEL